MFRGFIFLFSLFSLLACSVQKNKTVTEKTDYINVVIIGAAGSGKGVQSELLKKKYNLYHVSAGDVLREYKKNKDNKYAKVVNEYTLAGKLLPLNIVSEIVENNIEENFFNKSNKYSGLLLDGYPRQLETLPTLDKLLAKHNQKITHVVVLNVPNDVLIKRLSNRGREDDKSKEAVTRRLNDFTKFVKPVIDEYKQRKIVFELDGTKTPEAISNEIVSFINKR